MFPLYRARRAAAIMLAAATLTACGGGDGMSDPTPAPQASYDLQAGMTALVKSGLSVNVTLSGTVIVNGTSTPFTGTGTFTLSAGVRGTFNRVPALLQTESITGTVTAGTQSSPYNFSVVNAYDTAGVTFLGASQSNEFDVAQSPILLPMALSPTETPLGTISRYTDETLSVVLGTTDVTANTLAVASTVQTNGQQFVELNYKTYDSNHALVQTDSISYGLTAESTLKFYSAASQNAAGTLSVSAL